MDMHLAVVIDGRRRWLRVILAQPELVVSPELSGHDTPQEDQTPAPAVHGWNLPELAGCPVETPDPAWHQNEPDGPGLPKVRAKRPPQFSHVRMMEATTASGKPRVTNTLAIRLVALRDVRLVRSTAGGV